MPRKLIPANQFTIQDLTDAYNQTRVDYLVPMPLNAARLTDYINIYDIDMERSVVALNDDQILGINMLGVRQGGSWITRLGVLPVKRRAGTGESMMQYLMNESNHLGFKRNMLEVIKDNHPAHQLFRKCGFYETKELLILRRPPNGELTRELSQPLWLQGEDALELLRRYPHPLPWTNQVETYINADDIMGIFCVSSQGDKGWLVFRKQKFYLTHFVLHTEEGDPVTLATELLSHIHGRFPHLDTHIENLEKDDPHLPAFWNFGYFETFRRIEMYRDTTL